MNGALKREIVSITMGCAWKYERSFLVATRRANTVCSRWLYRVSTSAKDLLTKNISLCFLFLSPLNKAALTETSKTAKYTKSVSPISEASMDWRFCKILFNRCEGFITFLIPSGLVGPLEGDKERL